MKQERKRLRLRGRDYAEPGFYFVTICTAGRREIFGSVENDTVILSDLGKIADECWRAIPEHFRGVQLGTFIIMPNHIHGLVLLPTRLPGEDVVTPHLSDVVGQFKAAVSRTAKVQSLWQRSFMDRIVRDGDELERIRAYILMNPERWAGDRYNASAIEVDDDMALAM
jgi:REP element-mobilizing transposase RayT